MAIIIPSILISQPQAASKIKILNQAVSDIADWWRAKGYKVSAIDHSVVSRNGVDVVYP